jgi:hypothetical protein
MIVKLFSCLALRLSQLVRAKPKHLRIPNCFGCGYVFREMMPGVAGSRDMR